MDYVKYNTSNIRFSSYRDTRSYRSDCDHQWLSVSQGEAAGENYRRLQSCCRAFDSIYYRFADLCHLRAAAHRWYK